jgi:serine/threonine-protein kinase
MLSSRTARTVTGSDMARSPVTSGSVQQPSNPAQLQSLPLEEVTKKLAIYIGPVAKLVVKKIAAECTSVDQLYAHAAKQISSEPDRQKFLRSRHA